MNYNENEKNYTGIWPFEKYSIEDIIEVRNYISTKKISEDPTCSEEYQRLQRIAKAYIICIGNQLEEAEDKEKHLKKIAEEQDKFIRKIRDREALSPKDKLYHFREIFTLNMRERVILPEPIPEKKKKKLEIPEERRLNIIKRGTTIIKNIPEIDITDCEKIKRKPESELTESEKRKINILYVGVLKVLIDEIYEKYKNIKKEEKKEQKVLEKKKEEVLYV